MNRFEKVCVCVAHHALKLDILFEFRKSWKTLSRKTLILRAADIAQQFLLHSLESKAWCNRPVNYFTGPPYLGPRCRFKFCEISNFQLPKKWQECGYKAYFWHIIIHFSRIFTFDQFLNPSGEQCKLSSKRRFRIIGRIGGTIDTVNRLTDRAEIFTQCSLHVWFMHNTVLARFDWRFRIIGRIGETIACFCREV